MEVQSTLTFVCFFCQQCEMFPSIVQPCLQTLFEIALSLLNQSRSNLNDPYLGNYVNCCLFLRDDSILNCCMYVAHSDDVRSCNGECNCLTVFQQKHWCVGLRNIYHTARSTSCFKKLKSIEEMSFSLKFSLNSSNCGISLPLVKQNSLFIICSFVVV